MTADIDFDDAPIDDELEELEKDEGPPQRRNPLRIVLLVLIVLVLLCVVCFLASRFVPIPGLPSLPGLPGVGPGAPTPPPAVDTPTPLPSTEEAQLPPEATEEPAPTEEGQLPATEEPVPTGEAEVPATEEPPTAPTEEPTEEAEPPETVEPVPGPTSTPTVGPTVVLTVEPSCDDNSPPVADAGGPYDAMMGKGQAIVTFDGSGSSDPDGAIESYEWDFGDSSAPGSGETVTHGYTSPGAYMVELTVTDDCGASSQDTTEVTIVGPTPPANGSPTPPPTTEPPEAATLGFCHLVQYGQTLSGIAAFYGVPWQVLAEVNGVGMGYFVIAGQGLFIPVSEIQPGPNLYEVQPGDTLNDVAYQCGLSRTVLADANNLDVNVELTPGQRLIIPLWRQVYP